jgi:hypothetical protein
VVDKAKAPLSSWRTNVHTHQDTSEARGPKDTESISFPSRQMTVTDLQAPHTIPFRPSMRAKVSDLKRLEYFLLKKNKNLQSYPFMGSVSFFPKVKSYNVLGLALPTRALTSTRTVINGCSPIFNDRASLAVPRKRRLFRSPG